MVSDRKDINSALHVFMEEWNNASDCVLVHTSGSTGKPKPILVSKERMLASASMTCDFLGLKEGDTALLCMPLDYIAGKMVVVRSIFRKLKLVVVKPSGHPLRGLEKAPVFTAMVPMQVFNSLKIPQERDILKKIKHLIIGGGAIDDALESELRIFPNNVWSTYGMTETLSHIALRRLNGNDASEWYTPFEGIKIDTDEAGCLVIQAPDLCEGLVKTNDIVELSPDRKRFKVIGRRDNVIDSGGIKIHIEDVEQRLRNHVAVPYLITKKPNRQFGEIVVMLVQSEDISTIRQICESVLPKYWQPRLYIPVKAIPLTETGKPARAEAERIAKASDR